CQHFWGTPYTF
nr:immunoglobulin light chain junction region [Mus musculus]NSL96989.1 immunoglobulin light chain junction region [Mus musculus]NSL96993.1 immunoglobulin light chain junction region [Mus musculus]NSL97004.1 immunoglobulin light chain junction region [Mus musculus]NSL97012.1 immunoglobulin light chain junction region [Mus musculus]